MKVTAIFYPSTNASKVLGDASVTIRTEELGELAIKKLRVIQGESGVFVAFPQFKYEKDGENKYATIVWASSDWKGLIDAAVLKEYERSLKTVAK